MNRRRFKRKEVTVTTVELCDGSTTLVGVVRNVSNTGIGTWFDNFETVDSSIAKFHLRLVSGGRDYRVGAIMRWQKNECKQKSRSMGMRVCEAPRDWSNFVDSFPVFEPAKNV